MPLVVVGLVGGLVVMGGVWSGVWAQDSVVDRGLKGVLGGGR